MFNSSLFSIRVGKSIVVQVAEKIAENVFQFLLFDNCDIWQCLNFISDKKCIIRGLI